MAAGIASRSAPASLIAAGLLLVAGCSASAMDTEVGMPSVSSASAPSVTDPTTPPSEVPSAQPSTTEPDSAPPKSGAPSTTTPTLSSDVRRVLGTLQALPVKGRAPKTGYTRGQFGPAWSDDVTVAGGHNGCDTRNDILRRDLTRVSLKPRSNGCTVVSGTLADPYTGSSISFVRGTDTSDRVQIDHLVSLSDAWQTGAQQLSPAQRQNFANDPANLQATDGPTNDQKRDSDAASWLPPDVGYRCTYVARQIIVKAAYRLWVTSAERDAMRRILLSCNAIHLPRPVPAPQRDAPIATSPASSPTGPSGLLGAGSVYYRNCAAARAAGAAPLHRGDPGYRPALDRDGDGVACE